MKVILYMAVSANGFIARENDDTSWISKNEWDSYSLAVRTAGSLVVGRRTYDLLTKQPEFSEFKDVKLVALSSRKFTTLSPKHLIAGSPKEALNLLSDFKEVIVAGGSMNNTSFIKENLIDEIYIDIEPIVLGRGFPLFANSDFESKLGFLGSKMIDNRVIQLHYKVLK